MEDPIPFPNLPYATLVSTSQLHDTAADTRSLVSRKFLQETRTMPMLVLIPSHSHPTFRQIRLSLTQDIHRSTLREIGQRCGIMLLGRKGDELLEASELHGILNTFPGFSTYLELKFVTLATTGWGPGFRSQEVEFLVFNNVAVQEDDLGNTGFNCIHSIFGMSQTVVVRQPDERANHLSILTAFGTDEQALETLKGVHEIVEITPRISNLIVERVSFRETVLIALMLNVNTLSSVRVAVCDGNVSLLSAFLRARAPSPLPLDLALEITVNPLDVNKSIQTIRNQLVAPLGALRAVRKFTLCIPVWAALPALDDAIAAQRANYNRQYWRLTLELISALRRIASLQELTIEFVCYTPTIAHYIENYVDEWGLLVRSLMDVQAHAIAFTAFHPEFPLMGLSHAEGKIVTRRTRDLRKQGRLVDVDVRDR